MWISISLHVKDVVPGSASLFHLPGHVIKVRPRHIFRILFSPFNLGSLKPFLCLERLIFYELVSCLSFETVERAALAFAEQLDTAHKGLCTWKNNPCPDTLAYFPPTPLADLKGAYTDRCEALLQLSALPVISEAAKYQMKLSRGPQVDKLLSEPNPTDPGFVHGNAVSSSSGENEIFAINKNFYEVSMTAEATSYHVDIPDLYVVRCVYSAIVGRYLFKSYVHCICL